MSNSTNVDNLDTVTIGGHDFAELSVFQQSFVLGKQLSEVQSTQYQLIATAALIILGGETEPTYDVWVAYQDGAIAGHQSDEDKKTGKTLADARGPAAAKKDAQNGRTWFSRHCKKPLVAYWASQDPAREFVAPFKTPKAPAKKLTSAEKAAEKVIVATKNLLSIETAKARTTRDALTKIISAAARNLTDALKAGDPPTVKSAKAKLAKIEQAITKAVA